MNLSIYLYLYTHGTAKLVPPCAQITAELRPNRCQTTTNSRWNWVPIGVSIGMSAEFVEACIGLWVAHIGVLPGHHILGSPEKVVCVCSGISTERQGGKYKMKGAP